MWRGSVTGVRLFAEYGPHTLCTGLLAKLMQLWHEADHAEPQRQPSHLEGQGAAHFLQANLLLLQT